MTRQRCAPTRRELLRGGLALAGLGLLSGCAALPIGPRQQARLPRIGYLTSGTSQDRADGFRLGLADHGYVEGQNIVVEWRDAEGRSDRLRAWPPSWSACRSMSWWRTGAPRSGP